MRSFWAPVMLSEEVVEPDCTPVRLRIMGEDLIAFRDTSGVVGLLDRYCRHRRADLFFGRNEEHGLRCIYHGWKYDATGDCVDLPNCQEGPQIKGRMGTRAYPTIERGGIVWAYMGQGAPPEFPHVEMLDYPAAHRHVYKILFKANYLQMQEGDMDLSHTSFLHSRHDNTAYPGSLPQPVVFQDRAPYQFVKETAYGVMFAARRDAGDEQYNWRIAHYLMPFIHLIAVQRGTWMLANIRVPIDDEHCILFRSFVHPDRPLSDEDRAVIFGGVMGPEMIPGTFTMKENIENDYLIDREVQRATTFSGIRSIVAQDGAVTEKQGGGPVADRDHEHLVSADRAITALRKKLLMRVKAIDREPPREVAHAAAYAVRAVDLYLPKDVPIEEGSRALVYAGER